MGFVVAQTNTMERKERIVCLGDGNITNDAEELKGPTYF